MWFGAFGNILLRFGDFAQELGETLFCLRADPQQRGGRKV